MSCLGCHSEAVTKDGCTPLGGQRFGCGDCGHRFTRRSNSAYTGRFFPDGVISLAVRWYVRYRLSYAEVSEWRPSAASWSIRAPSTAGSSGSYRSLKTQPDGIVSRSVSTGESTRPTLA